MKQSFFDKSMQEMRAKKNEYARLYRIKNAARVRDSHRVWNWNSRHPDQKVSTGFEIDIIKASTSLVRAIREVNPATFSKKILSVNKNRCPHCDIILSFTKDHNCLLSVQSIKEFGHSHI